MTGLIEVEQDGRTTILTLCAPQKRNAISMEMRAALLDALEHAVGDDHVRSIVLTGKGDHFCAGGDLGAAHSFAPDPQRTERNVRILQDIVRLIAGPKPVLAAVEGSAFGAGMSLAVACDFVIAAHGARFAASFAKVGLSADAGLTWLLPQRVGLSRSRRLMISGDVIDADDALAIGLADQLVPAGDALAAACAKAGKINMLAPLSIRAIKDTLAHPARSLDEVLETELGNQVRLASTADYIEGRTAFIEKRSAVFIGA